MKHAACLLLVLLAAAWPVAAQDDSLFEDELIEEAPEAPPAGEVPGEAAAAPASGEVFLTSPELEWGGSFESTFTDEWTWDGFAGSWDELFAPATTLLTSRVAADLFFDARPAKDFRVFGKFKAAYAYDSSATEFLFDARIFELFSDFSWKDRVFFRVGKHTIQWGVGYFFSPADILNLVSIDPEDPTAEREGPVSLKAQFPFGQNNAYLYLIANDVLHPAEIGIAPKVELVIGGYEIGAGGFYQRELPAGLMLTATGPLGKLDLFGEAVLQYAWQLASGPLVFSATFGGGYLDAEHGLSVFTQYLFAECAIAASDFPAARAQFPGTHRLAAFASWSKIFDSDFALSLLYLANLADGSGMIQPSMSWTLLEHATLSVGARLPYGGAGDEYAPTGPAPAFWIGATLGAGKF